jgi:pimeloyl-ACP methyl ester carboxylesterase
MKMLFQKIFSIVFFILTLSACTKIEVPNGYIDDFFNIKNNGEIMPVRVTGKADAEIAIIIVHGGPGLSSVYKSSIGINDLEKDFKIVYYDQRGSGVAQGNADGLTVENLDDDLDAIVDYVHYKYQPKALFVMGQSWGGGLSTYYVANTEHQKKINGYISVCPAYNIKDGLANARTFVINTAQVNIATNTQKDFWKKVIAFYDKNPYITADNYHEHMKYVGKAGGAVYKEGSIVAIDPNAPNYELLGITNNFLYTSTHITLEGKSIFNYMDLTPMLPLITVPTLLIWGVHDGILPPVPIAQTFIDNIGTTADKKQYRQYTLSGHSPQGEEATKFTNDVKTFCLLND